MKKLYFIIAALIACVSVNAQSIGDDIHTMDFKYFPLHGFHLEIPVMPAKYSFDNKSYMLAMHSDETATTIDVINDEVETIKTITVPNMVFTEQPYSITRTREFVTLNSSERRDSVKNGVSLSIKPEEIQDLFRSQSPYWCPEFDSCGVIDGYKAFFNTKDEHAFYNKYKYGSKYPIYYCLFDTERLVLILIYNDYSTSYNGEWVETKTLKGDFHPSYAIGGLDYLVADRGAYTATQILVTQTLFNNDEAFEYLQPVYKCIETSKYEYDRDNDGFIDEIITEYGYIITGFNIMSENGNILHTLSFEEYPNMDELGTTYGLFYDCAVLFDINDKAYFMVRANGKVVFYIISPGTNEIKQVGQPIKMDISPRIVNRNENINVTLSESDNAAREILVRNAAGQTVHKATIPAGQKSAQINSSRLSNGLNVVSVKDGNNRQENCKVVVK